MSPKSTAKATAAKVKKTDVKKKGQPLDEDDLSLYDIKDWLLTNAGANKANAALYQEFSANIEYLKSLSAFQDWESPEQLKITKDTDKEVGAFMAPFNQKECEKSLSNNANVYVSAVPFPYFQIHYSAQPGVQLSRGQIQQAIDDDSTTFELFPMQHVAVTSTQTDFRELTCISPEETRIAKVGNFVRRHKAGMFTGDDEWEFRRIMYCIPTQIFKMDSVMKRYFKAIMCRRLIVKQGRLVKRSASQVVDEIMSLWRSKSTPGVKCTAVKIMEMYKANLGDGDAEDDPDLQMSAGLIGDALIIQKLIKDIAELNLILQNGDETLLSNSPFFAMNNLAALAKKHKTTPDLKFAMEMVLDMCIENPGHVAASQLSPRNDVGLFDVFVFKNNMKSILLDSTLEDMAIPVEEKSKFRECLSSVSVMRQHLGGNQNQKQSSLPAKTMPFLSGSTQAGEHFFIEAIKWIYGHCKDDIIMDHCRNNRKARDVVKLPPLVDLLKSYNDEAQKLVEADADAPDALVNSSESEVEFSGDSLPAASTGNLASTLTKSKSRGIHCHGEVLCSHIDGTPIFATNLDKPTLVAIKAHLQDCVGIIDRECLFVVPDKDASEDEIASIIRNCGAIDNYKNKRTAVVYEVGTSGVAACNSSRNPPPYRKDHFEKLIKAALHSRLPEGGKATCISPMDEFYIYDCKKSGNHNSMKAVFNHNKMRMSMADPKILLNVFDQDTAMLRASRSIPHNAGFAITNVMEHQQTLVISSENFGKDLIVKDRKHFGGKNNSANIGFVKLEGPSSPQEFRATPEEKLDIIGTENTVNLSSANYVSAEQDPGYVSEAGKPEPVFWQSLPETLWEEMIHSYDWERVVHLTTGNGALALASCKTRTPGIFVCHTDAHKKAVRKHVIKQLFRVKQDPSESMFDPTLVTLLEALGQKAIATTPEKKAKGNAKNTPDKTEPNTEGVGKKRKAVSQSGKKSRQGGKRKKGMDGNPAAKSGSDDQSSGEAWSTDDAD